MSQIYLVIPLTRNQFALIDFEDADKVLPYKWHCTKKGYAARRRSVQEGGGIELMHRTILGLEGRVQCDHRFGDKLDNRRYNLRAATNGQNQANQGPDKKNTTGYKGVTKPARVPGYVAQISINGKNKFIGYFRNKHDAARAYNATALEAFGEFAYLNTIAED